MARIYDNIETKFTDGLRGIISNIGVKRVDFTVGYFNVRGWSYIADLIDKLPGDYVYEQDKKAFRTCRLLIGMQRQPDEIVRKLYSANQNSIDAEEVQRCRRKIAEDFKKQLTIGVPTATDEQAIRDLSRQLKADKIIIKLYLRHPLHAKLYLAHRPDDNFNKIQSLMGSSNLTYSGLSGQGELNAEFGDSDDAQKFSRWFDERWDDRYCIDITNTLVEILDGSWASEVTIPPYYIYLKTAYHLSQEARNGINEYSLPPEFQKELFDFQATAVKLAARYLDKRGGAMIGDVVGLGKTITACAVAKVYEMRNACSTLILCPANLQEMWKKYVSKYDLKADVQSVSKKIDYKASKYYRLVIIDESHNLRNNQGQRYKNIRDLIEYQDCKVLLLTATPYNKEYIDLSNQLKLFVAEDSDLGIQPEAYIRSLGGSREYATKHSEDFIRSIKAFEHSNYADDWRDLMRLFLVRRTRTFIKENYAKTDEQNNRKYLEFSDGVRSYFPERQPKAVKFTIEPHDQFSRLYSQEMMDLLGSLKLPRYGLVKYLDSKKTAQMSEGEQNTVENLTRAGTAMMGFCRTTFMKRLDSSGVSFLISVFRHLLRNAIYLHAIKENLSLPIGDDGKLPDDYTDEWDIEKAFSPERTDGAEQDDLAASMQDTLISFSLNLQSYYDKASRYYQSIAGNSTRISWIPSSYFKKSLKTALEADCQSLLQMLALCGSWDAKNDQKLNALETLLCQTHKDEKVVVFSQFADTAQYIAGQLKKRNILQVACVTGDTENPTAIVERFSPQSNGFANLSQENQIRILVATDVLSEGQNLQDSHTVVNFDLPWAIIRLVQRAGRVDRIGQQSQVINCYSFFPAEGIENIIKLRQRLNARINESAQVVGGDEVFFEGNEQNLTDLYNEKSSSLDEEEDSDVDLASQAFQIWKTATEANPSLKKTISDLSNVVYSSKQNTEGPLKQGVITYAKSADGNDMLTWMDSNFKIVTQSQQTILHALACPLDEPWVQPLANHHEILAQSIQKMQQTEFRTSGILGSRFSTKYQLYTKLDAFCKNSSNALFVTDELKAAVDDIYNYPLCESAKNLLGSQLRRGFSLFSVIDTVLDLRKSDQLCIKKDDDGADQEPQIICSMGLV